MSESNQLTNKNNTAVEKDYKNLLHELKDILNKGLYTAYKAVDNIKVQTYWQIGERIVREELKHKDRAEYGKYLIENLAVDLSFNKKELYKIIQFYRVYPIVGALRRQLSWRHYLELIRIEEEKTRKFYEQKAIQNSWGYRELHKQIKNELYEKTSTQEIEKALQIKLPTVHNTEVFKDVYEFDFLEDKITKKEKDLENQIIKSIEAFLSELGNDIAFLGRQVPIKIDNETHFIDMVLYHCGIPCKILVDLKIGKITSADIGQMNKYVGYYRKNRQYEHEKDTIGLIIGKEAGKEEIEYALNKLEQQIFIATYKAKLPSKKQIKEAVKKLS
jgi:predicted nuclease of restriction endonuclease-like (RecB) superfamily